MKTSTLLRIAAIVTFLYFAGHTSGIPWTPGEAPSDIGVITSMRSDHFDVVGVSRSYWDFYVGFGVTISLFLLLASVLLWQLASLAKTDPRRTRPMIFAFLIFFALNTAVAWLHFFPIPGVTSTLITLILLVAFIYARGRQEVGT